MVAWLDHLGGEQWNPEPTRHWMLPCYLCGYVQGLEKNGSQQRGVKCWTAKPYDPELLHMRPIRKNYEPYPLLSASSIVE
jgi:hypothetical protein